MCGALAHFRFVPKATLAIGEHHSYRALPPRVVGLVGNAKRATGNDNLCRRDRY